MIQPRVCGDYVASMRLSMNSIDTTPRVRGLLVAGNPQRSLIRYNPACAGTTFFRDVGKAEFKIQPRVCGDYLIVSAPVGAAFDTTPRVRGLPLSSGS